ncbi:MAG: SUMF1/EgtB/PvdO family nonheme iron enzyme [Candidatus Eisenbacteria sp.]|nr:SUMF1/EgtB/PvdO family nonheme iron enzyme [Candidatus Eisenbacteria bacterium]
MRKAILASLVVLAFSVSVSADYLDQMVIVPAGTFIMGDGEAFCGVDEHEVTLTRDFYLGQHEVTNQEYIEALQWAYNHGHVTVTTSMVQDNLDGSTEGLLDLNDNGCEIRFDGAGTFHLREAPIGYTQLAYPDGYNPADHPVIEVTWHGAVRYCDWLSLQAGLPRAYEHTGDWSCNGGDPYAAEGYRLPTDAEWEYAAQWDDERIYPWGNAEPNCDRANYGIGYPGSFCVGWTSPVGTYPDAPEALGLSDMAGNLYEWCNDRHVCDLGTDPVIDPTGGSYPYALERVLRGGAWQRPAAELRCAIRDHAYPSASYSYGISFRVARTVDPQAVKQRGTGRSQLILEPSKPNPFTAGTRVSYLTPSEGAAVVNVYDATGRMIRTLRAASHGPGSHSVTWDARNQAGEPVPAGIYLYELRWKGQREARRMLLVR